MVHRLKKILKPLVVGVFTSLIVLKFRLLKGKRVQSGPGFVCNWRLQIKGPGRVIFGPHVNA